jgi:hypothetical protein
MELTRLGVFWEANGGEFGGGKERAVVEDGEADGEAKEREEEREEREWEKEVVGALESLKTVSVTDGWVLSLSSFEVILVLTLYWICIDPRQTMRSTFRSCISFWIVRGRCWRHLQMGS